MFNIFLNNLDNYFIEEFDYFFYKTLGCVVNKTGFNLTYLCTFFCAATLFNTKLCAVCIMILMVYLIISRITLLKLNLFGLNSLLIWVELIATGLIMLFLICMFTVRGYKNLDRTQLKYIYNLKNTEVEVLNTQINEANQLQIRRFNKNIFNNEVLQTVLRHKQHIDGLVSVQNRITRSIFNIFEFKINTTFKQDNDFESAFQFEDLYHVKRVKSEIKRDLSSGRFKQILTAVNKSIDYEEKTEVQLSNIDKRLLLKKALEDKYPLQNKYDIYIRINKIIELEINAYNTIVNRITEHVYRINYFNDFIECKGDKDIKDRMAYYLKEYSKKNNTITIKFNEDFLKSTHCLRDFNVSKQFLKLQKNKMIIKRIETDFKKIPQQNMKIIELRDQAHEITKILKAHPDKYSTNINQTPEAVEEQKLHEKRLETRFMDNMFILKDIRSIESARNNINNFTDYLNNKYKDKIWRFNPFDSFENYINIEEQTKLKLYRKEYNKLYEEDKIII